MSHDCIILKDDLTVLSADVWVKPYICLKLLRKVSHDTTHEQYRDREVKCIYLLPGENSRTAALWLIYTQMHTHTREICNVIYCNVNVMQCYM